MRPEELASYEIVIQLANPAKPTCDGPLLIHVDGAIECHGRCGDGPESGLVEYFHDRETPEPCSRRHRRELELLRHGCIRCR